MAKTVRQMMKEQHKGMFIALRGGELDELIIQICGAFPEATPLPADVRPEPVPPPPEAPDVPYDSGAIPVADLEPLAAAASSEAEALSVAAGAGRPQRQRALSNPNLRKAAPSLPPPGAEAFELDVDSLRPAASLEGRGSSPRPRSVTPRPESSGRGRYAAPRPPAIFADVPPARSQSIFGGDVISEKSLDEVILSYLAEDLEEGPERHD
jgi:hypothetical protein